MIVSVKTHKGGGSGMPAIAKTMPPRSSRKNNGKGEGPFVGLKKHARPDERVKGKNETILSQSRFKAGFADWRRLRSLRLRRKDDRGEKGRSSQYRSFPSRGEDPVTPPATMRTEG